MAEVLGRDRDRDNDVAGAKAGGAGMAPGKRTLAGELSGPVLPMLPGPPPAAYDDPATVAGPNKSKTLNWDDPAAKYGIKGDGTLRSLYKQHLMERLQHEPLMAEIGYQGGLASELGKRIEGIADGSKPVWAKRDGVMTEIKGADEAQHYREALWRCAQRAIVDTLATTQSDIRYKKETVKGENNTEITTTFCNVYGADMVNAMGGYLPRVWYAEDLNSPVKIAPEKLATHMKIELSANQIGSWLNKWGAEYGWRPTGDAQAAQQAANAGRVVIIQATNTSGSGHVNVILAEGQGHEHTEGKDGSYQPLQSQAGKSNFGYSDTAGEDKVGDSWWKAKEGGMKPAAQGNFWIYEGKQQATAVDSVENMGSKMAPP